LQQPPPQRRATQRTTRQADADEKGADYKQMDQPLDHEDDAITTMKTGLRQPAPITQQHKERG